MSAVPPGHPIRYAVSMNSVTATPTDDLAALYLRDETAWLDATAELLRTGRVSEIDTPTLVEYLTDMATRDRREVKSRLVVLLTHLLKWQYQPAKRSRSWHNTIVEQRQELEDNLESGSLRAHADQVLGAAYRNARERAAGETELPLATFPADCPYTVEQLLAADTSP